VALDEQEELELLELERARTKRSSYLGTSRGEPVYALNQPSAKPWTFQDTLGMARSFAQGPTLGWAEEAVLPYTALAAKIGGADEPLADIYRSMKEQYDWEQSQFERAHPYLARGAEVAGAMVGGGPVANAVLKGTGLGLKALPWIGSRLTGYGELHPYLTAVGEGGVLGGLYGAGTAPEGKKLEQGLKGAAMGGAMGSVAYPLWRGMQGTAHAGKRAVDTPTGRAEKILAVELKRGGVSVGDLAKSLQEGKRRMVADVGGPVVAGELRAQHALSGEPRSIIEKSLKARASGSFGRLERTVRKIGGRPFRYSLLDDLENIRQAEVRPLLEASKNVPVDDISKVVQYLDDTIPTMAGTKAGRHLVHVRRMLFKDGVPKATIGELHVVRREIDDIIGGVLAKQSAGSAAIKPLEQVRTYLTQKMEAASPDLFLKANRIHAGNMKMVEAFEAGTQVLKADPQITGQYLARASEAEKDAFLLGLAKNLREQMARREPGAFQEWSEASGAALTRIYSNLAVQERLKAALPKPAYKALMKAVAEEKLYAGTFQKAMGGSPTARIEAEKEAGKAANEVIDTVTNVMRGRTGFIGMLLDKLSNNKIPEPVRVEMAKLLTSRHSPELIKRLEAATQSGPVEATMAATSATRYGMAAREGAVERGAHVGAHQYFHTPTSAPPEADKMEVGIVYTDPDTGEEWTRDAQGRVVRRAARSQ
jgi:hypothetical protein